MRLPTRNSIFIFALVLLSVTAIPARSAGKDNQDKKPAHHHYKVVDLGTFGGPSSYFNSLSVTDVFLFGTVFYNIAQVRNSKGVFVGFAETSAPDPYPGFCYLPDCFVAHAFQWKNGIKTDLGALPGGASSAAFWINAKGWITGNSENGETDPLIPGVPEIRAVRWKDGQIRDLGTLGGSTSFAQAINNRGQITGLALNPISDPYSYYYVFLYGFSNGSQTRGFFWDEKDGMQDIGTLGGPDAFPSLINQRGQVAGFSYTNSIPNSTPPFVPTFHPFLWEKGKGMKDLGSLGGTQTASVNGLNERGEVVGGLLLPGDVINHPFLWDGEKLTDLTAPPFSATGKGEARWINEAGEVVGNAELSGSCDGLGLRMHAFLWRNGAMTDLGKIAGTPNSQADFINSKTQIVGGSWSCDTSVLNAFLWEDGSIVDLNTLIPPDSPLYLYWAPFIDDRGEIGAFGTLPDGDSHAVLVMPCDENHPAVEGCDYSMVDTPAAVPLTSFAVRKRSRSALAPSLMRRMGRYRLPGPALGPKN